MFDLMNPGELTIAMTSTNVSEFSAMSSSFALLSKLWLHEVDSELLQQLNNPNVKASYESLGGFLPSDSNAQAVEQLAVEYCELLVGPRDHVSPIQSVWNENRFQSDAVASMRNFFELISGYEPPINLVDHLGVQLDFVSRLMLCEATTIDDLREIIERFNKSHLGWSEAFLDRVEQTTTSKFYRGLARITRNLILTIKIDE